MGKFRERSFTDRSPWNMHGTRGTNKQGSEQRPASSPSTDRSAHCCLGESVPAAPSQGHKQGRAGAGHLLLGCYAANSHQQGLRRGQSSQTQHWTATKPEQPLPSMAPNDLQIHMPLLISAVPGRDSKEHSMCLDACIEETQL